MTAVFAPLPKRSRTPRRAAAFFFRFALTTGASDAVELGYVPLPPTLVGQITGCRAQNFLASN